MDLLLWRHAHALDASTGQSDLDRPLSAIGEKQAKKMSDWLRTRLPKDTQILCSPALRTLQTVSYMDAPYTVCEDISPASNAHSLLKVAGWFEVEDKAVLIVGHQPSLAESVVAIFGLQTTDPISFRKGSLWWIRQRVRNISNDPYILTIQDPELL